jgi:ATP-dependent 26S proteasome regulatory subunit
LSIDPSAVVKKYIGGTEKNLKHILDAAEDGCPILFIGEADALFGKRSEMKNCQDRHGNQEIIYPLPRLEAYHGSAVLAINEAGSDQDKSFEF